MPLISGFLGSDILAATLATELDRYQEGTMLVDVGTNGEVILLGKEGLFATSCATGPAFEGAAIRHGMQAISGAIDSVRINRASGEIEYSVIQKDPAIPQKPFGICGSGVVSIVAELLRAGILLKDGRFNRETHSPNFHYDDNGAPEFVVVSPEKAQTGRAVTLTQKDVRAIQLAKGALRTGIELLCQKTGRKRPKQLLVAGAFGNFIKQEDALTNGMFPELSEHDIEVVGNAAGAGAILTLFDAGFQSKARKLRQSIRVLDLTIHPEFQEAFVASLPFPAPDKSELKNN